MTPFLHGNGDGCAAATKDGCSSLFVACAWFYLFILVLPSFLSPFVICMLISIFIKFAFGLFEVKFLFIMEIVYWQTLLPLPPTLVGGCFHICLSLSLFVNGISQVVMNGFGRNLVDRLCVWRGLIDSILMNIWLRLNFLSRSSPLRGGVKPFWTSCNKIRCTSW